MRNKKSIVLSSMSNSEQKAVLTLQEEREGVSGTLRLYNFASEFDGICSLGMYHDRRVDKAGLTLKGQMLYEFFLSLEKIPESFSVAVVNFVGANPTPVLFGSSQKSEDSTYANIIAEISEKKSFEKTKQILDDYGVDFDEEEKASIEKEIDKAFFECDNKCENCVYKNYFYEEKSKNAIFERKNDEKTAKKLDFSNFEEKIEEKNENKELKNELKNEMFFDRLKPQIDKLFENNPVDEGLQELIPSSKFVRVEYEDAGDFFVFGLLYDENGNVTHVCYGVPSVFEEGPPEELSGYPVWLPLGESDGFGYWLTYQDASTGEPVKAVIS